MNIWSGPYNNKQASSALFHSWGLESRCDDPSYTMQMNKLHLGMVEQQFGKYLITQLTVKNNDLWPPSPFILEFLNISALSATVVIET